MQILGIGIWQSAMLDDPTMQFTAIFFSFQSTSIPDYTSPEEKFYIDLAVDFYYDKMPAAAQKTYKGWKDNLIERREGL